MVGTLAFVAGVGSGALEAERQARDGRVVFGRAGLSLDALPMGG